MTDSADILKRFSVDDSRPHLEGNVVEKTKAALSEDLVVALLPASLVTGDRNALKFILQH